MTWDFPDGDPRDPAIEERAFKRLAQASAFIVLVVFAIISAVAIDKPRSTPAKAAPPVMTYLLDDDGPRTEPITPSWSK